MKIYNTMTRKKEEFTPLEEGHFKIYVCGPTVYNYIHIGNARPFSVFDTLRKYLEFQGNKVTFVQNFTDIDDKLITKANEEGITVMEVADRYIKEYETDTLGLGIRPADVHPRVSGTLPEIFDLIQSLLDKGYAYKTDNGDVYFRVRKFKDYGKLSKQSIEDLESGARVDVGEVKEDPLDFALWKAAKPGEPAWDSPFSSGRPGWHIECSAMSRKHLGETIDLHAGGQDLIFPHHENEIAQSECGNGCEYARYWMHNGYINVDNEKMSKSLGNFFTVRDVAEEFGYEPIRFLLMSAHYRSQLNYSIDNIKQAIASLERMYNAKESLAFAIKNAGDEGKEELREIADNTKARFIQYMDDDLNTADALAAIFDYIRDINKVIASGEKQTKDSLQYAYDMLMKLTEVLGLLQNNKQQDVSVEVENLIAEREEARKNKDFNKSDEIRDKLKDMGVILKDTPQGVTWSFEN